MGIKNLMFGDIEIEKNEFHRYKISKNVSSGENKL